MSTAAAGFLAAALERALGRPVARDEPLAAHTTYRLGGPAAVLVEVGAVDELGAVSAVLDEHPAPVVVVGKGSNLLVADEGFPGLAVLLTGEFSEVVLPADEGEPLVSAGGAVPLPVLARRTAGAGRSGLEFYVGIPGTAGGAVKMNAGGHGRDTSEVLDRAWLFDLAGDSGTELEVPAAELGLGYRSSAVTASEVVTRASFRTEHDDVSACEARIDEVVRWRREHQPGGQNAGSVFRNPPDDSAGRIIEASGLKGHRVGGARVSEKHANFFQAEEGASANDVYRLVHEVRAIVSERTGLTLDPELRFLGFPAEDAAPGSSGEIS